MAGNEKWAEIKDGAVLDGKNSYNNSKTQIQ